MEPLRELCSNVNTCRTVSGAILQKKWSFPLRISLDVTKSVRNCGFGHIYWRNPSWKTFFFVQCYLPLSCTSNRSIATALNCIGRLLLFTIISTATSASPDSTNCRLLDTKEKEECVHKPLRYLSVYTTMGGAFTYF